ncbi:MAG: carboxymuconolactone decarboxylase family protein [Alphaproteobacteria bacterium]|nr:carboxymuconolactone decarboxylase family protein [Alphaproteobacteria bacterium]
MVEFTTHDEQTAPEGSRELLQKMKEAYGFIPNLGGAMAQSPAMLGSLMALAMNFMKSSLNPVEQQVVAIATSAYNGCAYCVASHSMAAQKAGMTDQALDAVRTGGVIEDEKLEALHLFTVTMVEKRGWTSDEEVQAMLDAGYTNENILDAIVGITMKTLTNYTNHVVHTELNEAYEQQKWDATMYAQAAQ